MAAVPRQAKVLAFGVFLTMMGLTLVAPILPLYAREFGVSRTAAGALISSFAVARLVFDLIGGVGSDRFGGRNVLVASGVLLFLSSVGAALAPNYGILLVTRVLEGVGSAAYATSAMRTIVLVSPKGRLGRTMAFYQMGLLAGVSIGPVVGGFAAELGDYTTPFWIYAAIGIAVSLLAWWQVPDEKPEPGAIGQTYREAGRLARRPVFLALMFVAVAIFFMRAGTRATLFPLFAGEELDFSESQIGLVLALAAVLNLAVVNIGGWLVDRAGRTPILVWGLAACAVVVGLHGYVTTFGGHLVLSMFFGVASSLMSIPPHALAGDLAPPGLEGASVGLFRTAGDVGLVAGPLVLGGIAESGAFKEGFFVSAALLAAAAAVSAVAFRSVDARRRAAGEVPVEVP